MYAELCLFFPFFCTKEDTSRLRHGFKSRHQHDRQRDFIVSSFNVFLCTNSSTSNSKQLFWLRTRVYAISYPSISMCSVSSGYPDWNKNGGRKPKHVRTKLQTHSSMSSISSAGGVVCGSAVVGICGGTHGRGRGEVVISKMFS